MYVQTVEEWAAKCAEQPEWAAQCLNRIYRFGGQHPTATVLRHVLEVAWLLRHEDPQTQLWGLHHDSHEILLGDCPRPFKGTEYNIQCDKADDILIDTLGLELPYKQMQRIESADVDAGDSEYKRWDKVIYQSAVWGDPVDAFVRLADRLQETVTK